MNLKKKIFINISIGILAVFNCFGQQTPEQLGIEFLNSLKSNDSTEIKKIIPQAETLLEYSKDIGIEKSEEEKKEFLKAYPNEVNQFLNRFNQLKKFGENLGVKWALVEFQNVEVNSREQKISEREEPIVVTDLNVIFDYQAKSYRLILNSVFEYNLIWYLAGDRPRLEEK